MAKVLGVVRVFCQPLFLGLAVASAFFLTIKETWPQVIISIIEGAVVVRSQWTICSTLRILSTFVTNLNGGLKFVRVVLIVPTQL